MAHFEMQVAMDNAAFEDNNELPRILRETADKINRLQALPLKLRDVNGNTVGEANVIESEPKDPIEVDRKFFNNLIADRKRLIDVMILAVKYLDHPDVQAIPFAIRAVNVAKSMHEAISAAEVINA